MPKSRWMLGYMVTTLEQTQNLNLCTFHKHMFEEIHIAFYVPWYILHGSLRMMSNKLLNHCAPDAVPEIIGCNNC